MPNSTSKLSLEINDQYFTPTGSARWCFVAVGEMAGWDFKGTALEPAVGAFAFPNASNELGLELNWTTNDLFPQDDHTPDLTENFKSKDFGSFDYVITNPPFGYANSLARSFMSKALTIAPRVMMLLPKGARRIGFQDAMPRNARKIVDLNLNDESFITSTGETKVVKTCVQAWETSDEEFPRIKDTLDLRTDLFDQWGSQLDHWKDGMDLQVVRWGNMGRVIPTEKQRKSGSLMSVKLKDISREDFVSIQESLDFSDYKDMSTAAPAFDVPAWVHRFNTEAVRRGLLSSP